MPRRQQEKDLHVALMTSQFDFIGNEETQLEDIYQLVQAEYGQYCDDEFKCNQCCRNGHPFPEWQHVVRATLQLAKIKGYVQRARFGYWQRSLVL